MGQARRTRLWIALPGGIAINGLLLAGLILFERMPSALDEPPIVILELERPQRQRPTPRRASTPRPTSSSQTSRPSLAVPSTISAAETAGDPAPAPAASPEIEPAWRVDPRAVERWRIQEGNPAFGWGRYYRACKGLSSEHMTDEEKDRCYGGWGDAGQRMAARFGDALAKPPPSRYDRDAAHQERCRAYRAKRVAGNTTRHSAVGMPGLADGPSLSEGGCF